MLVDFIYNDFFMKKKLYKVTFNNEMTKGLSYLFYKGPQSLNFVTFLLKI